MIRRDVLGASAAIAAASAVLSMGGMPAYAADLGGNCCADLEERIAELEATTARKGNRKVSLTVSGWINQALFLWDDGEESNAYVGTNELEQSRVRFVGEAKIEGDWSAGYTLELGLNTAGNKAFNQDDDEGNNGLSIRKSNWWLKSKSLGKVTVGREGTATYHLLDDADFTATRNASDAEAPAVYLGAFRLRRDGDPIGSNLRWVDLLGGVNNDTPGQNGRRDIVRYDSPEFAGFVFTASWGEDDQWGTALTYKNDKLGDFSVLAKVGYEANTDDNESTKCSGSTAIQNCEWWGAAATVMHTPTGLYVYGAYGELHDDARTDTSVNGIAFADDTDTMWFVQGGIQQKWLPLGTTTIFGEYRHDDTGSQIGSGVVVADDFISGADINHYAVGVVQKIDNAAMELYLMYRHTEGDFETTARVDADDVDKFDLDDFDMVITGARISF